MGPSSSSGAADVVCGGVASAAALDRRVTLLRRLTGGGVLEDARSLRLLGVSGMMIRCKGRLTEAGRSCEKEGCRHSMHVTKGRRR